VLRLRWENIESWWHCVLVFISAIGICLVHYCISLVWTIFDYGSAYCNAYYCCVVLCYIVYVIFSFSVWVLCDRNLIKIMDDSVSKPISMKNQIL